MKNNVKAIRVTKGLTQEELAKLLGVSRQTIISIESSRYVPSTVLSLKISKFLDKRVEELFELEKSDFDSKSSRSS
ncbi:helix-turn-helix transcriptional regulator [Winogradskyella undariae]|jgi:putative transcriptional regulator|uniref:helix-turn-helix transcriptional regulator n=1 Tax=Winogradskyella undariae TaxID=1285465 RepID=UPI00156ADA42|nr:helix-turn-helix transcriptional regulator [Winogradskyella undariae]NRR93431.1 helix-turn-helix transcriptional regulator [Winogradskyella undariae]